MTLVGPGQTTKPRAGPESGSPTTNRLQSEAFQACRVTGGERSEAVMVTPEQTITGVSGSEPMLLRSAADSRTYPGLAEILSYC